MAALYVPWGESRQELEGEGNDFQESREQVTL